MRVVFMGTPDFSVPTLIEIISQGHEIVAVYSQPPRKAGRGMALTKSPVHQKAEQFGLPVFTPENFRNEVDRDIFNRHQADIAVVVAYGLLLPPAILAAPRYGCLNLHASLLPRWRGAAPINRAIMAGDKETGVMVMRMEAGLDTGPIAMVEKLPIDIDTNAGELHDRLMVLGGDLMARALGGVERGSLVFQEQAKQGVTYAHKLTKDETRLDWRQSAAALHDHIRALAPFPGAWSEIVLNGEAQRLKVLRAILIEKAHDKAAAGTVLDDHLTIACAGGGALRLVSVQRAGKGVLTGEAFLRGHSIVAGMMLG